MRRPARPVQLLLPLRHPARGVSSNHHHAQPSRLDLPALRHRPRPVRPAVRVQSANTNINRNTTMKIENSIRLLKQQLDAAIGMEERGELVDMTEAEQMNQAERFGPGTLFAIGDFVIKSRRHAEPTPEAASQFRRELHALIQRWGQESDVTVYQIIGALRVAEHDLIDSLDQRGIGGQRGEQAP